MKAKILLLAGLISTASYAYAAPVSDAPDVVLERLDETGVARETVGDRIIASDTRQSIASFVAPGQEQSYLVRIKNLGESAATFNVSLRGILPSGAGTPWKPRGWSAHANLDGDSKDIFAQLNSENGWVTPLVNLGKEAVIRLSLVAPATADGPLNMGSFRVAARKGDASDVVVGEVGPQFIAKIQWTLDADESHPNRWHDVTDQTSVLVTRRATLGVRAVKADPKAPWGGNQTLGPTWTLQGNSVEGNEVWMQPQAVALTGAMLTATAGNSKSFQVRVLPDAFVTLDVDNGYTSVPTNGNQSEPVVATVTVGDEDDEPLANVKVRLRALKGNAPVASFWTPLGADKATKGTEQILVTNERGQVEVQWSVAAGAVPLGSKVELKAEAVDEEGRAFGDDDTFNVTITGEDEEN